MHKKTRLYLAGLAILVFGLVATTVSGCSSNSSKVVVEAILTSNQKIDLGLEFSGVLLPAQTVDVSSRVTGQVASLGFTVGSKVKKGDILVTLDSEAIKGQLRQAQASLQSAEAAAQTARNQVDLAKIKMEAAQRAYERNKSLYESGALAQSQWEDVQDNLSTAKKQYETAAGSALKQAQAAIDTAQANVKNYSLQMDQTTIESPLDGILASQNIDVGEVLSQGSAVISLVDTSTLRLKTTIAQENLTFIKTGQEVDISVDAYPDLKLLGIVSAIGPVAVSTGEVFPMEISVKNDKALMAGLSAHASLQASAQGITIPYSALVKSNGKSYVFVINDHVAYRRQVSTDLGNHQNLLVLSGLTEGEAVAVTNVNALADKTPVDDHNK